MNCCSEGTTRRDCLLEFTVLGWRRLEELRLAALPTKSYLMNIGEKKGK